MDSYAARRAVRGDLASVLALVRAAGLPSEGIDERFPDGYVVARAGAEVVAVAGLEVHGEHGLLRSVTVADGHRGAGLARRLVEERLRIAEQQGLRSVYLLTTTAAEYFKRLGFEAVSRASAPGSLQTCSEFSSVCPASAACLAKSFARAASFSKGSASSRTGGYEAHERADQRRRSRHGS